MDIAAWLDGLGLGQYEQAFRDNEIDERVLPGLTAEDIKASGLAGEPIISKLTRAPGNQAPIGGLKVITENGWFAARPSGTENLYKIYAESFKDQSHLDAIVNEAQQIVNHALL